MSNPAQRMYPWARRCSSCTGSSGVSAAVGVEERAMPALWLRLEQAASEAREGPGRVAVVGGDHGQRVLPLAARLRALDEARQLTVLMGHRLVVEAGAHVGVALPVEASALEREVVGARGAGRAEEFAKGGTGSFGSCTTVVWKCTQHGRAG